MIPNSVYIILSSMLIIFSFTKDCLKDRITGFLAAFIIIAIATTHDILHLFFYIINGIVVYLLLLLSFSEKD